MIGTILIGLLDTVFYYIFESQVKEEHTLRVCKEILQLGKALDLNKNALRLAETIALFHGIGRFEQFRTYGTFNDKKSENHATLELKVLEETNVLSHLTKTQRSIAYNAIGYHNVRKLPDPADEKPDCLFGKGR